MPGEFPFFLYAHEAYFLLGAWALVCGLICTWRHFTTLAGLMVLAGVLQSPLIALTGSAAFQLIDDIPATMLIVVSIGVAFRKGDTKPLVLLIASSTVVLIAAARSPALSAGIAQARQVLDPVGLVFAGYELHDRLNWPRLMSRVATLGVLVAIWMIVEGIRQWPLFDPTPAVRLQTGDFLSIRDGLPLSYFADNITQGSLWFRPGGPFLNPPTAGFFLAVAALALLSLRRGFVRFLGPGVVAVALGLAFARAGLLILVCVTVAYWAFGAVGKLPTLIGMAVGAVGVFGWLAGQGNTASHSQGLIDGLLIAVRTIFGSGLGAYGYQSINPFAGGPSESLLGLYFGWMGLPMVALVGWLIYRIVRGLLSCRGEVARLIWFGVGILAAAAVSETASSLEGTSLGWMLVGLCISPDLRGSAESPLTAPAPGRPAKPPQASATRAAQAQ